MSWRTAVRSLVPGAVLVLVVACGNGAGPGGSDEGADAGTQASTETDAPTEAPDGAGPATGTVSGLEACDLLTDDEVTEAIGPHLAGEHDYLLGGCIWEAETPTESGLTEAIHATVLPRGEYEMVADIGEPIDGYGEGATYDDITGELWFPCLGGDFCGIKAGIGDSDGRQAAAERLAQSILGRW